MFLCILVCLVYFFIISYFFSLHVIFLWSYFVPFESGWHCAFSVSCSNAVTNGTWLLPFVVGRSLVSSDLSGSKHVMFMVGFWMDELCTEINQGNNNKMLINQQYFRYIVEVSFIGGGNRSTRIKPLNCCKSLTIFIT